MVRAADTDHYIKICLQAWLFCESCIHSEISTDAPRKDLVKQCHDCSLACFAVVAKLVSKEQEVGEQAFNCILQCRQCQEECEKYPQIEDIRYCGVACKYCADKIREIAIPFFLN